MRRTCRGARRRPARVAFVLSLATAAATAGAGCEYSAGVAPPVEPRIGVHAVLDVGRGDEVVLVERTLTAGRKCSVTLPCAPDPLDPIVSAGGDPISGATVIVYGPAGDSAVAVEDASWRADHRGAGVYRFVNSAVDQSAWLGDEASLAVVSGGRYALRVVTPIGTARGATSIPATSLGFDTTRFSYNVDRSVVLRRQAVSASNSFGYLVQAEGSLGRVRRLYDGAPRLTVFAGTLFATDELDPTAEDRLTVGLLPGLPYTSVVGAVDENYRRSLGGVDDEDPFSSENPGSSIEGGVGVFGSYVPVASLRLDVVADVNESIEGRWVIVDGPLIAPASMLLYSFRGSLSGNYQPSDPATAAIIGTRDSELALHLSFYGDRFQNQLALTFEGAVNSLGELRGTFRRPEGTVVGTGTYRKGP